MQVIVQKHRKHTNELLVVWELIKVVGRIRLQAAIRRLEQVLNVVWLVLCRMALRLSDLLGLLLYLLFCSDIE